MSLESRLYEWYKEESCPPDREDGFDLIDESSLEERRWGTLKQWVYADDNGELIAVSDVEPATEMQFWGEYGAPEIYPVKRFETLTIEYLRDL